MKMYDLAYSAYIYRLCFGKKAWSFILTWSSKEKRLLFYHWWCETKNVWWERINSYPFKFWGIFILPNNELFDLDED